jgi:ABC-type branched-subunit amino acid transport system substrate-binding protein
VEAVTGLSRRSLILLGLALVIGVVASTVATVVSPSARPGCPEAEYGCATFEPGEPVVLGVLASDGDTASAVRMAVELHGGRLAGRPVRILAWTDGCRVPSAARGARELATDAPDEPPVVAVVAETCLRALTPAAQILSDSGVTLVSTAPVALPTSAGDPSFYLVPGADPQGEVAPAAAGAILDVAQSLARPGPDGALLIPRTPLRDALSERGFVPGA